MKNLFKGKLGTITILTITFILAGVAIFTAVRLYQLRSVPVAPTAPTSKPKAAGQTCGGITGALCPSGEVCVYDNGSTTAPFPDASGTCQTQATKNICQPLTFTLTQATATATSTATATATPTGTAEPTATPTRTATPTGAAPTATATTAPTTAPAATATQEAALPDSGTSWPTMVGMGIGVLVIIGSLLLAF